MATYIQMVATGFDVIAIYIPMSQCKGHQARKEMSLSRLNFTDLTVRKRQRKSFVFIALCNKPGGKADISL